MQFTPEKNICILHMAIKNHFHKQYLMIKIYQNVDEMHFAVRMTPLEMKRLEKKLQQNQKYLQIYSPKMQLRQNVYSTLYTVYH